MEINKIIGYVLLLVGFLLIAVSLWYTYSIFTGGDNPIQVFESSEVLTIDPDVLPTDIQGQMQNALIKVIPLDFINDSLNLMAWLMLMWILIYGGGKIASIGVKLIKHTAE